MEDKVISQAQYTIVDLNDGIDGVDGYTVILTNESHAIQCDFLGNPLPGEIGFASSKANSTIIVYKGEQKLSAIGLTDAMALGKFKYSLEPKTSSSTCLGDRATNDKFYLKELYSDSGSLLINITLDNNQTVVREFTWTKAKHGEDAKYIKLRYNNVFKYPNKTSTTPTPTSIDISMDIFNITNYSIAWKYLNSSGSYVDVVSGTGCVISSDKKTLTINDKALFVNDICKIKAICTDTTYNKQYVDEAIIYKQYDGNDGNDGNDGADAYSCVLTNESDTILFDQNGTIKPGQINSTTCKASSSIMVKKGTQTLNPVSESATPGTGQYKFKFEPAPINCTVARNGDSAFYITGLTSGKDNGKVSVSIYLEGNTNKIVKEYTWNKVIDGVDARFVTVEGEDKFSYDNSSDTTPTPTSIVLTATAQNIPSPTYKWQYYNGTLVDIVSGTGSLIENNRLTIDDKKLFPNGVKTAKIQCSVTYNGITYSDTKSIIKVYDGDQGEVGPPGSDSKTVIISGQNQIKYDKNNTPIPSSITLTATPNNYKSPTYKWYYVTSAGANLISGQTTNKLNVAHNSAWFASDIALIRVECRENSGSDLSSFDFSITRSYDGSDATSLTLNITGGTRNVCYNGKNNLLTTVINPFTIELYEDTTNVSSSSNVRSITWSCSGHYTIGSANVGAVNFKPTPINTYDETKLDTSVSVTVNYKGRVIKQIVPVSVSKNSTALDWVEEWDGSKVEVGGTQIISPKIFAGKKDTQTNLLTGIALGQDIVNKNDNIGMAIYYNNKLLGRINADPSVDNNNILVLGALEGKQVTLNTSGEVVIGGGLKVSVGSTTTTVSDISNTANKGVSDAANASALASNAQANASKAQSTADGAKSQAQDAINRHNDLASDSKLTPVEKQQVFADFEEIKKEKVSIDKQADIYGVSKSNFTNRYDELNTYLYGGSGILVTMNTTSTIVRTDFTTKFNNYYTERQNVLDLIASKAKEYTHTVVDNLDIGTVNYILNTDFESKQNTYSSDGNITVKDGVINVTDATVLKMDLSKSFGSLKTGNDIVLASIATQSSSANIGLNKFIGGNIDVYSENHTYIKDSVSKLKLNMITVPVAVTLASTTASNPYIEDWALNRTKAYLENLSTANLITKDTRLIFEPHPIVNGGNNSETEFNPANKSEFFTKWKELIKNCITSLNKYKFYGIYIGTNFEKFDSTESDLVYWDTLCKDLKVLFNNHKLIYRTNWWTTASWSEELKQQYQQKLNNPLWSKVDIISIASYFELNSKAIPTVDELYRDITKGTSIHNRNQNVFQEVKNFYDKWKKPVIFGELGCPSKEYGASSPWSNLTNNANNQVVQANLFEAYNKAFIYENGELDNSWFLGYSIFTLGTSTTEYDVVNKQAQAIINKGIDFIYNNNSLFIKCQINDKVSNKTIADITLPLSQMMNSVQSATNKLTFDSTSTSEIIFNLKPNAVFTMSKPILSNGTKASSWSRSSEDIDKAIENAKNQAQDALNKHNDMANDNKLTPVEKQTIKREMEVVNGEKQKIIDQANILSITTQRDAYITAYNNLNTYVSPLISNTTTTSDINGATHRAKFADYYNKRQDLLNAISTKLKAIGDNAQGSADTANRLAQSAQNSANDAQSSANVANNKHAELASDNKLTPSEKKSSKKEWDIIVSEKSKIEGEASRYGVSVSNYQTKYNTLSNYITPILTNLNTTSDIVGTTYRLTFKEYYDARQDVLNSITTKAKQLADSAQTSANAAQSAANNAQSTANTAQSNANTANTLLSDIANDNKLTSSEKKVTKLEWDVIVNEKDKIVADATKYSQSTTDYVNKYNALNTYITPILSNINTTSDIVGTTFRTNFANYYSSRQDLLNAISAKSKELADNAQSSANTANSIAQSAQTAANNAQSSANTANNKHAELSNDNKLTAIEKHSTKKEWDVIVSEKAKIESEANKFGVSLTTYQSKYNDLNTYVTPLLSNLDATSDIVGTTYRQKFKDYYDARQDVLNSITSKAKQLADNAQSSANNANNKADQLNTWKKEAEQKITPEAITNTVKSAVDVDGQQLFAKMADVKITAENMIATFSEVGGVNLLRNSEFKSHTNNVVDFWYPLRWDASAGGNHSISVRPIGNTWALNNRRTLHGAVNGLPTTAKGKNLTAGFDSEYFEVQPNQTYTLGCLIAAHRTKDVTIEMLCFDASGNRIMGDNHACWIQDVFNYTGGNDRKNWKRIVHRWTPQENAARCILRAFMGEYLGGEDSALFWIAEPVVVKGVVDPIWTVSSDENYTGIVKSDKDGVEVEMKDGEGSQGKALLGYQGLEIFDSGGHRKAWFGNNDSAQIDKLKVNSISNRHMLKWSEDRPFEFYVASSSTGDGSGRDPSNKSNSISNVLNWIWNNYGVYSWRKDLNIFCDPGTYNENIVITGWLGSGVIRIYFHPDSTWYGQHTIEDNTMAVYLLCRGTNDSMQWNNHGQMFRFRSSENNGYMFRIRNSVVWLVGGRFCKEGWSGGFNEWYGYDFVFMLAYCGAKVYLSNNDIVGFYKYLEVNDCSFVVTYQNRGHCYKFASVNYGGLLNGMGRIPMHSGGAESYNGGKWWDLGDVGGHNSMWQPKDTAPPPPPAPTYQWMEGSFGTSGLRTAPEGSGSGTTARNGEWGQGKWGSYKPHRGYADLGGGPSNWCGGGDNYRNVSAWITLTRLGTSHGIAGATPRPRFKEPNGNFWDSGVGFARGDTKTIQLPSSIANAIANGSMQTLEMWAGTSTNDYSFYNNTSIKIKCEKKV